MSVAPFGRGGMWPKLLGSARKRLRRHERSDNYPTFHSAPLHSRIVEKSSAIVKMLYRQHAEDLPPSYPQLPPSSATDGGRCANAPGLGTYASLLAMR